MGWVISSYSSYEGSSSPLTSVEGVELPVVGFIVYFLVLLFSLSLFLAVCCSHQDTLHDNYPIINKKLF